MQLTVARVLRLLYVSECSKDALVQVVQAPSELLCIFLLCVLGGGADPTSGEGTIMKMASEEMLIGRN